MCEINMQMIVEEVTAEWKVEVEKDGWMVDVCFDGVEGYIHGWWMDE